jgi:hypothetical protein
VAARHAKLVGRLTDDGAALALDADVHVVGHGVDGEHAGPAIDGLDAQARQIGQLALLFLGQVRLVVRARIHELAQVVLALGDHEDVFFLGRDLVGDLEFHQGLFFVARLEKADARFVVLVGAFERARPLRSRRGALQEEH